MFHQTVTSLPHIIFFLAAIFYLPAMFIFTYFIDKREYGEADGEKLYELAKLNNWSEYHVFSLSAEEWHIGKQRMEQDFTHYLLDDTLPYYVKNFVRNNYGNPDLKKNGRPNEPG